MADSSAEEGLSHECRELLPSLPKQKGWRTLHLYQYHGFWYPSKELQALLAFQRHFQARDTDLVLVTTPKSGTIWLKALAFAIVNRSRYTFSEHPLLNTNPHELIPFFEFKVYGNNQIPDLSTMEAPRLFATHIPYTSLPESIKDSDCRLIYLCRNPKDTFISFWLFMNKLRPNPLTPLSLDEAFELFCMGSSEFGPFWDHVLGYWKESLERPQKVLFLKYEEMKEDTTSHLKKLAEFLGYPFSLEEEQEGAIEEIERLCSFEKLSSLEVNKSRKVMQEPGNDIFFRRGKVGDWVNYLSEEMADRLDSVVAEKLKGSALAFDVSYTKKTHKCA